MAEKDITIKKIEDFTDVFADIVNVLLFKGERRVEGKNIFSALPRSIYKVQGEVHEQERDTAKYWRDENVCFALIGIENQSTIQKQMPIRVISYDGADYRAQIRLRQDVIKRNKKLTENQPKETVPNFYPVISIVLYFGLEKWNKPLNLKSCFTIPEGLEEYVNDYEVHLFEIAYLNDETVAMFQSDFCQVAEYFVQSRKIKEGSSKEYKLSAKDLIHAKEIMELMTAMTGDHTFENAYNSTISGGKPMWTLIDYVREQEQEKVKEAEARAEEAEARAEESERRADMAEAELRKAQALIAELRKSASGSGNN